MQTNIREMEEYSETQFVIKSVYKGEQSEALVLYLSPGQEMPAHPHESCEVTLLPHKGTGILTIEEPNNLSKYRTKEVALVPETLYYEPNGCTFKIKNTGIDPLQILITLIRVEKPPV